MRSLHIDHVDKDKCSACEECVHVCPEDCFEMVDKDGKITAVFSEPDKCTFCGKCLTVCEEKAIVLSDMNSDEIFEVTKPEMCCACESCVKMSKGKGFEMIEKEGKIYAMRHESNLEDNSAYFACPNVAVIRSKKDSKKKTHN
jgi:NAD-dependent dihydropyrimidine dehydrogenase PreA subunit